MAGYAGIRLEGKKITHIYDWSAQNSGFQVGDEVLFINGKEYLPQPADIDLLLKGPIGSVVHLIAKSSEDMNQPILKYGWIKRIAIDWMGTNNGDLGYIGGSNSSGSGSGNGGGGTLEEIFALNKNLIESVGDMYCQREANVTKWKNQADLMVRLSKALTNAEDDIVELKAAKELNGIEMRDQVMRIEDLQMTASEDLKKLQAMTIREKLSADQYISQIQYLEKQLVLSKKREEILRDQLNLGNSDIKKKNNSNNGSGSIDQGDLNEVIAALRKEIKAEKKMREQAETTIDEAQRDLFIVHADADLTIAKLEAATTREIEARLTSEVSLEKTKHDLSQLLRCMQDCGDYDSDNEENLRNLNERLKMKLWGGYAALTREKMELTKAQQAIAELEAIHNKKDEILNEQQGQIRSLESKINLAEAEISRLNEEINRQVHQIKTKELSATEIEVMLKQNKDELSNARAELSDKLKVIETLESKMEQANREYREATQQINQQNQQTVQNINKEYNDSFQKLHVNRSQLQQKYDDLLEEVRGRLLPALHTLSRSVLVSSSEAEQSARLSVEALHMMRHTAMISNHQMVDIEHKVLTADQHLKNIMTRESDLERKLAESNRHCEGLERKIIELTAEKEGVLKEVEIVRSMAAQGQEEKNKIETEKKEIIKLLDDSQQQVRSLCLDVKTLQRENARLAEELTQGEKLQEELNIRYNNVSSLLHKTSADLKDSQVKVCDKFNEISKLNDAIQHLNAEKAALAAEISTIEQKHSRELSEKNRVIENLTVRCKDEQNEKRDLEQQRNSAVLDKSSIEKSLMSIEEQLEQQRVLGLSQSMALADISAELEAHRKTQTTMVVRALELGQSKSPSDSAKVNALAELLDCWEKQLAQIKHSK